MNCANFLSVHSETSKHIRGTHSHLDTKFISGNSCLVQGVNITTVNHRSRTFYSNLMEDTSNAFLSQETSGSVMGAANTELSAAKFTTTFFLNAFVPFRCKLCLNVRLIWQISIKYAHKNWLNKCVFLYFFPFRPKQWCWIFNRLYLKTKFLADSCFPLFLIKKSFVWFHFVHGLDHKGSSEFRNRLNAKIQTVLLYSATGGLMLSLDLVLVCVVRPVGPHNSLCGARTWSVGTSSPLWH